MSIKPHGKVTPVSIFKKSGGGKAKAYQVRQVLKAIERMNTDDQP